MENQRRTIEQLLNNPSFVKWVKGELNEQEAEPWDEWVKENEQNRMIALQAQQKITQITFKNPKLPDVQSEWDKVHGDILEKKTRRPASPKVPVDKSWHAPGLLFKIAAMILIGAFAGLAIYQQSKMNGQEVAIQTVKTGYGEKKIINLSDSSTIILAAGSELAYKENWLDKPVKRVSLNGEAFFSITPQKTKGHPKFVVETEDGSASVWGTQFTVDTYGSGTKVVLQEGDVRVEVADVKKDGKAELRMKAGEMAVFSKSTTDIELKKVNPRVYTSWTTNELFFDNTPLSVLINRIERTYGVEVKVRDPEILEKNLSGSVDFISLDGLITAVSEVLDIRIHRSGETLIINQNKNI